MKTEISRNVIVDLLPVYLSGEVSADTRRIVEEYMQRDPEMGERLREASSTLTLPATQTSPDLEKRALQATQNLLGRRFTLAIFAYTAAYSVFSFRFRRSEIVWLLYRDWPAASYLLLAASAALWICFFMSCRKLMAAGLLPAARHSVWRWLPAERWRPFPSPS